MDTGNALRATLSEISSAVLPGTGWLTERLMEKVAVEHSRRASEALKVAEAASGMSREELGDLFERSPHLVPLYLQVLYAAGMNGHESVLKAMGGALGLAATAASKSDAIALEDLEATLAAMKDFTPRHFRVLASCASATDSCLQSDDYHAVGAQVIARVLDLPEERVEATLVSLSAVGLVSVVQTWDGNAYPVSELGSAIVAAADLGAGGAAQDVSP